MKGDVEDIVGRLRLTLPDGWFGDNAPIRDGLFAGFGAGWASLYRLLAEVRLQARLFTVSGQFLDLACRDFFADRIARRLDEGDAALRVRFQRALRRSRATRAALIDAAAEAGYSARVFEPARVTDTGAYNTPSSLAWGIAGGWGSLSMPLEALVTIIPVVPVEPIAPALAEALPAGGRAWVRLGP